MNTIDMTGQRFGRLLVLRLAERGRDRHAGWLCLCDCGTQKVINGQSLRRGKTQSCGCLHGELAGDRLRKQKTVHGLSKVARREYCAWNDMIRRCRPTDRNHVDYFDRGIVVCEEWNDRKTGFPAFLNHIGPRPSAAYSLDRINNDKGYHPGNVRWATRLVQIANQRQRKRIDAFSDAELVEECRRRGLVNSANVILKAGLGWSHKMEAQNAA